MDQLEQGKGQRDMDIGTERKEQGWRDEDRGSEEDGIEHWDKNRDSKRMTAAKLTKTGTGTGTGTRKERQ